MNPFERWLRSQRLLCVCYEILRWVIHKVLFFWPDPTPVWYGFNRRPSGQQTEPLPLDKTWYHIRRPLYWHEQVYYNLDNALSVNPHVKGFAFVFFMGIGDYLYTTPLFEALKQKYPNLPFYGYVGAQFDRNNSPLVGKLLEENPNFEKVFYFSGSRHPFIWKNYDYSEVLNKVPENFLVIPVYYNYGVQVTHRVASLFETFGLPVPQEIPVPKMYFPKEPAPAVTDYLTAIRAHAQGNKGIVFLQLDSRSSNYVYPYVNELAQGLTQEGYFVLSVTRGGPKQHPQYLELDIKKLSINQTWQLLDILRKEFNVRVISVISVFWAASAGLKLPNLGLHHWVDPKIHNVWYPNIQVVTNQIYPFLPREKQTFASPESYTRYNRKMVNYKPQWIIRQFMGQKPNEHC